jgi:AcrR family transcriptional regulator
MTDTPVRGRREQRRADLVQAAIRAVRRIGAAVSIAEIAAAAGITKPVLYRHFTDRADLQVAVGEQTAAVLLSRVGDELGRDRSPVEQTRAVIDVVLACVEEDPELWRFVTHRSARSAAVTVVDHVRERIAQLLATLLGDELRSRGRDSGGAEVWARGLVGMVHRTAEWWLDHRTTSRAALVDDLAALAWSGIAGIFLAGTGIVEELTAPTPPAPSTR